MTPTTDEMKDVYVWVNGVDRTVGINVVGGPLRFVSAHHAFRLADVAADILDDADADATHPGWAFVANLRTAAETLDGMQSPADDPRRSQ